MSTDRLILHVDMDAFYASVEQRDNPELRGKPLVVGGTGKRGVVAAASYESRQFGIRSAMPMAEARRRCPHLISIKPRMAEYQKNSRRIFDIFRSISPLVEGLSLDEAFIDASDSVRLLGGAREIAQSIKDKIRSETGLTASVGVAPNKLVAKIASDLDKPDGLVIVEEADLQTTLDPLSVSVIPGIGRETLKRLDSAGIRHIVDLRLAEDRRLRPIFGRYTDRMRQRAAGLDDRPVEPHREEKSISAEETFGDDIDNLSDMERVLLQLSERVAARLRKAKLSAGTVQVKIRESDFTTYTRQQKLKPPSANTDVLYQSGLALLKQWTRDNPEARVRLLGIGGSELARHEQQDLFATSETDDVGAVDATVDEIREKFGDSALSRAKSLRRKP